MEDINPMEILQKLYKNSGLIHVAEHIVNFMNDSSVAQLRLVSKETNEFLAKIWQDRRDAWRNNALKEARSLCEQKFKFTKIGIIGYSKLMEDGTIVRIPDPGSDERSIFEKWPTWKLALDQVENRKQVEAATFLLTRYFEEMQREHSDVCGFADGKVSPLHVAAEKSGTWENPELWTSAVKVLIEMPLDFNTPIGFGWTILQRACEEGSREFVEVLLDNAAKKGINVSERMDRPLVLCAMHNDTNWPKNPVLMLLFERRNEFDIELPQDVLHLAACADNLGDDDATEALYQWAFEKGIDFGALRSEESFRFGQTQDGNTILHRACKWKPWVALRMLKAVGKYGFSQEVLTSMANAKNVSERRPIDIVGSYESFRFKTYPFKGGAEEFHKDLTSELEKYTTKC